MFWLSEDWSSICFTFVVWDRLGEVLEKEPPIYNQPRSAGHQLSAQKPPLLWNKGFVRERMAIGANSVQSSGRCFKNSFFHSFALLALKKQMDLWLISSFFWFRDFVCMLFVSVSIDTGQSILWLWMFGWWAEGGNACSFVWITVGAEKLSFHWFDQPRLAKNLSMEQLTTLFSHRSFLVKSVKIDQRGEFARSVGNRGVTWVITQRDLSLWATSLLLNKSDKVKQMWLQIFCFVLN